MNPLQALENRNVRAFLRAIRLGEGTTDEDGYRRIVGGQLFTDFGDHPRKRVWIPRYALWSTAAGAYQIIAPTWDEMRARYGLRDFSPRAQDLAAVGLIIRRGALDDVLAGRIEAAVARCRQEWASLPGSPYGQRIEPMDRVIAEYVRHGGALGAFSDPGKVAASTEAQKRLLGDSGGSLLAAAGSLATGEAESGDSVKPRSHESEPSKYADAAPVDESRPVWDRERGWLPRA